MEPRQYERMVDAMARMVSNFDERSSLPNLPSDTNINIGARVGDNSYLNFDLGRILGTANRVLGPRGDISTDTLADQFMDTAQQVFEDPNRGGVQPDPDRRVFIPEISGRVDATGRSFTYGGGYFTIREFRDSFMQSMQAAHPGWSAAEASAAIEREMTERGFGPQTVASNFTPTAASTTTTSPDVGGGEPARTAPAAPTPPAAPTLSDGNNAEITYSDSSPLAQADVGPAVRNLLTGTTVSVNGTSIEPDGDRITASLQLLTSYIEHGTEPTDRAQRVDEATRVFNSMTTDPALSGNFVLMSRNADYQRTQGNPQDLQDMIAAMGQPAVAGNPDAEPPVEAAAATGLVAAMGESGEAAYNRMRDFAQAQDAESRANGQGGGFDFVQAIMMFFEFLGASPERREEILRTLSGDDGPAATPETPSREADAPPAPGTSEPALAGGTPTATEPAPAQSVAVAAVTLDDGKMQTLLRSYGIAGDNLEALVTEYNRRTPDTDRDLVIRDGHVLAPNELQVAGLVAMARVDNNEDSPDKYANDANLHAALDGHNVTLPQGITYNATAGYGSPAATPNLADSGERVVGGPA